MTKQTNFPAKPPTGIRAGLSGESQARSGTTSTDALTMWLAGGLTLDDEGNPVDPLNWWIQQVHAGNNHGGFLQMALDVLSCPEGITFLLDVTGSALYPSLEA
ncbi:hypothetical protein PCANC_22755 [Puccinia coronata f. sp. avenae]|uniref:HAT C-terminal dimerisation domain-containing protein n=1 Tax=Puccinia coronata f. sp. avenae TaxID=200324 RepID=A0A2N5U2C4_9BASI|nr:hypothetical protein PCANC_22755 [Puccinia coronata f. sp. avenae]